MLSDKDEKEIAGEAAKHLVWDLMGASKELSNMSSYARFVIRKQNDISLLRKQPSKELRVRYNISLDGGYKNFVWWLLEEIENGNIKLREDVQSE